MRSFNLSGFVRYFGGFFPALNRRRSAVLAWAIAVGAGSCIKAGPPSSVASVSVSQYSANVVRVEFVQAGTPLTANEWGLLYGGEYINLSSLTSPSLFSGTLQSITPNLTLHSFGRDESGATVPNFDPTDPAFSDFTTAVWDLAVYIGPLTNPGPPPVFGTALVPGLLQVGGTNGLDPTLAANNRDLDWGGSPRGTSILPDSAMGTSYSVNVQSLGLTLDPAVTPPQVFLVNAYTSGNSFGRWSGYIDFTFASSGGSGVPDASRTALLLAPGTLALLGLAGRSRRRN
jgi:hypothetical protein